MAKLPRVFQRIFGANAEPADLGVIGSKHNGNPTTAASAGVGKNIANLMALSNFLTGLRACVNENSAPALQDHNSLFYIFSQQIAYLMQAGIAEWEETTEYYAGSSVVLYNGVLYLAKEDNSGIEPGVNANWTTYWNSFNLDFDTTPILGSSKAVTSNGIYEAINLRLPVGTILPFAGENIPAGFLLCDGAEISRTTYSNLFSVIGTLYGDGDGSASFNLPNKKFMDSSVSMVQGAYGTKKPMRMAYGNGGANEAYLGYYSQSGDYHCGPTSTSTLVFYGGAGVGGFAADYANGTFGLSSDPNLSGIQVDIPLNKAVDANVKYIIKY